MTDLSKVYLYRMTHIENIPHIIKYGITHSSSSCANLKYVPIGDNSLISTRNEFVLSNGRKMGEYIPFYFGVRTPMLYVVQNGYNMVKPTIPEKIVYCVSSVQEIINSGLDFVFTDGHAVDRFSAQYSVSDINNVNSIIDWNAVNEKNWKREDDLDLKRRKEAEFLVFGNIDYKAVLGFVVYNENAKKLLIGFGVNASKVVVKQAYYF